MNEFTIYTNWINGAMKMLAEAPIMIIETTLKKYV
jgi:hypothetical protein